MKTIMSPRFVHDYPEREIECEIILTSAFEELTTEACQAGWQPEEVAHAIMKISQDHIWTLVARAAADLEAKPHEQGVGGPGDNDNDLL